MGSQRGVPWGLHRPTLPDQATGADVSGQSCFQTRGRETCSIKLSHQGFLGMLRYPGNKIYLFYMTQSTYPLYGRFRMGSKCSLITRPPNRTRVLASMGMEWLAAKALKLQPPEAVLGPRDGAKIQSPIQPLV